ncbi:MAG: hypothetical protein ACM30G_18905 [Micromonosporaceae bacterium]
MVDQLRRGCLQHGIEPHEGVAEAILADRINAVSSALGVGGQHAMRTYFSEAAIGDLVTA